jgi:hypothetical protein
MRAWETARAGAWIDRSSTAEEEIVDYQGQINSIGETVGVDICPCRRAFRILRVRGVVESHVDQQA